MAKFYLVDPSLNRVGGHHFHQGGLLAEAAARDGWEPVVAAHRLVRRNAWTAPGILEPMFWRGSYAGFSVTERMSAEPPLNPLQRATSAAPDAGPAATGARRWSLANLRRRLRAWWRTRRARSIALGTAAALERFFARHPIEDGDVVVMPTVTEFDLVGVFEYLSRAPRARRIPWSFVCHFPVVIGPWTGSPEQLDRTSVMRRHIQELLDRAPDANLKFFATTPELVEQYGRLELKPFTLAPPPVRALARTGRPSDGRTPLRVLGAGGLRPSKTRSLLNDLVRELETDDFFQGRLQLWVQAPTSQALSRWSGDRKWQTADPLGPPPPSDVPLIHVPHPLPAESYERLLAEADIGLLAYADSRYAVLHSGVMAECLASGIPTVVPARTWMDEEMVRAASATGELPGQAGSTPREFATALRTVASDYATFAARAERIAPDYAARHSADAVLKILAR